MNTTYQICNGTNFKVDQIRCGSTEEEIKYLVACQSEIEREAVAQGIVANAFKRALGNNCTVRVGKFGLSYVFTIVSPHSQLTEMLPAEATRWIKAARGSQEPTPLNFTVALPHSILETAILDFV